jgi:hypothetical protein
MTTGDDSTFLLRRSAGRYFTNSRKQPSRECVHVGLWGGEGLGGGAEAGRAIEVEGQAKLITELLGEAAFAKAGEDAVNQKLALPLVDGAVLQAAAHEGAGPVMPVPSTLLADKLDAPFDGCGVVDQEPVGDRMQFRLVEIEVIAVRVRRAPCRGVRRSSGRSAGLVCR